MESLGALLNHATWLRRLAACLVCDAAGHDRLNNKVAVVAEWRKPNGTQRRCIGGKLHTISYANGIVGHTGENSAWTAEELLARHQLQQQLATLVAKLDDPFRTAILLRYAEALEPDQIARKLAIAGDTVQQHLSEALALLRQGLDEVHGGSRNTWVLALTAIASPRSRRDR